MWKVILLRRVLDKDGIFGPKNGRRLHVDVDLGILKLAGIYSCISRAEGLHCSGRMARSMDGWTSKSSHPPVPRPCL